MAADGPDRPALELVAEWANAEEGVTVDDAGSVVVDGEPPIPLEVTGDDERIVVTHRHTEDSVEPGRVEAARQALPRRGSSVQGTVSADDRAMTVTLSATVYIDGMTRQGFVSALNDVIAAADRLAGAGQVTEPTAAAESDEPTAETPPLSDSAPTLELSSVWSATHRVPASGLDARDQPDPALEPSVRLQARVELQITEQQGDWAQVTGSNGWTGWVDARLLEEIGSAASPKPAQASGSQFPLGLIGAAVIAVGAFLPWVDSFGASINSFDISLSFLWDLTASGEPGFGYLVVGLAVLAAIAALAPTAPPWLGRLVGAGAIAATGQFVNQVNQGLVGQSFSDTIDFLGIGVWVTLAGGVVALLTPSRR